MNKGETDQINMATSKELPELRLIREPTIVTTSKENTYMPIHVPINGPLVFRDEKKTEFAVLYNPTHGDDDFDPDFQSRFFELHPGHSGNVSRTDPDVIQLLLTAPYNNALHTYKPKDDPDGDDEDNQTHVDIYWVPVEHMRSVYVNEYDNLESIYTQPMKAVADDIRYLADATMMKMSLEDLRGLILNWKRLLV